MSALRKVASFKKRKNINDQNQLPSVVIMSSRNAKYKSLNWRLTQIIFFLTLLLLIAPFFLEEAESRYSKWDLEIGDYSGFEVTPEDVYVRFQKYDIYTANVVVEEGGPVDVYLMTMSEYKKMEANESFKAVVAKEGITETKFSYENPENDQKYILVVDNSDNGRSGDTIPTGYVHFDAEVDIEECNTDIRTRNIFIGFGLGAVAIIVIGIVVYKMKSR